MVFLNTKLEYARIQSPSSINTFRQCPRKYFYAYIEKLPTSPSIHLIRGQVAHKALEDFFDTDPLQINIENFEFELRIILLEFFRKSWDKSKGDLGKLNLTDQELDFYHKETIEMLINWADGFFIKVREKMIGSDFAQAFKKVSPITEKRYFSEKLGVQGYIDAIHVDGTEVTLIDYKTSKKNVISEDYRLQLGIYALLYKIEHGKIPSKVGINFLKFDEQVFTVDQELVDFAFSEILFMHTQTKTKEIKDFGRKVSPLCKWATGQCDFYETCKPHG